MRLADAVAQEDVAEACRLAEASKESLRHDEGQKNRIQKPIDRIFAVLREMVQNTGDASAMEIPMADAVRKCKTKGIPVKIFGHTCT